MSVLMTVQSKTYSRSLYNHIKMNIIPVIILFLTYYKSCEPIDTGTYLTPNVLLTQVVENMSVNINLLCGNHTGEISWRHNGNLLKDNGNQIHTAVSYFKGGNYTCHNKAGNVLNYTLVLQKGIGFRNNILVKSQSSEYISCTAKNFDGKFQCSWQKTIERENAELFHFAVARMARGSDNITCSLGLDGNTLNCEDGNHCRYAEEMSRISLSFYFRSWYRYEEYHRDFFIAEIVKPDKVTIKKVEDRKFVWEHPKTWSFPACYFQLVFQVNVVQPEDSCDHEHYMKIIQSKAMEYTVPNKRHFRKSYKLCVRAQEEASNSIWSDWSTYEVTPGK